MTHSAEVSERNFNDPLYRMRRGERETTNSAVSERNDPLYRIRGEEQRKYTAGAQDDDDENLYSGDTSRLQQTARSVRQGPTSPDPEAMTRGKPMFRGSQVLPFSLSPLCRPPEGSRATVSKGDVSFHQSEPLP